MSIPVQFKHGEFIQGIEPITLVGANGAGKTRLGAFLVGQFGYDRVSAQRNLTLTTIAMQTPEQARQTSESQVSSFRHNLTDPVNDLPAIMSDLKAQDVQSASDFRRRAIETGGNAGVPEETSLDVLARLWTVIFPGREIDLSGYEPRVRWKAAGRETDFYSTAGMSDGERSAFYHIARLLKATPGPVVIDEPEIHFHAMLARRFWDLIEAQRPDCRFIYITHDLNFALSRRGRVGIVRGPTEVDLLDEGQHIPAELFESILGAASLSVVADRIAFCEGTAEKSLDISIYGAWFRAPGTAVVPVGSCETVRRTFATFRDTSIIQNATPVALVERDYWPDDYLHRLSQEGLHVLPAHEVEGLLCLREVAEAVATHLGIGDFDGHYRAFQQKMRRHFTGIAFNKVVLERSKRDVDVRLLGLANRAAPNPDRNSTRANFTAAVDLTSAVPEAGQLYDEHERLAATALAGGVADMLRVFPGKECLTLLTQELGFTKERYVDLILEALSQPDSGGKSHLEGLRAAVAAALAPHLPPRE